ncbi:thiamine pyrophosphokinase [Aspergillus granulosus]|uniref:Thiamine pyrophosphokinase n=1 Tax=Aspergillus granulosus TaxID=176169 RepID=A0ABR4H474_9EURO
MEWDPTQFFREEENKSPPPFALVVLNQPINEIALAVLREHALTTICADGGANRFFEFAKLQGLEDTDLPDTIIGDLDSIRPEISAHYANRGVNIVQDDDQYSTDFTKSLRYLREHEERILSSAPPSTSGSHPMTTSDPVTGERRRLEILILGGLGGRVDQAFSQIHHLYMMNQQQSTSVAGSGSNSGNLYLISEESITFILQPGPNMIHVPRTNRPLDATSTALETSDNPNPESPQRPAAKEEGEGKEYYLLEENVGIIPLSGPARITTSGFQWDVDNWATEIGGQISTSNHIRAEVVHVNTNVPVLFTVELARRLKRGSR